MDIMESEMLRIGWKAERERMERTDDDR